MKVAIAGFGAEGEANYYYWKANYPDAEITIFDESEPTHKVPQGVKLVAGKDVFANLNSFDLVVRTASLNPKKIKTDGKVWSATKEFFEKCPAQIIGVTGTKGKGTTSTLIYEILKAVGKKVHLAGNIGLPMLEILPEITADDVVVLELSSFQLWDLTISPHSAVILMIEPDHLNVHENFEEYIQAKANIARYQTATDVIIYHPTNQFSAKIAATSPARKYHYMTSEAAHIENDEIIMNRQKICSIKEVGLIGQHNLENICAAITAAWEFTQDIEAIKNAVTSFKGLPHRLEFVTEKNNIRFYDDSYASAPAATIAAVKSFNNPEILICGGCEKEIDYSYLTKVISEQKNIKKVILMGQTKDKIANNFTDINFNNFEVLETTNFKQIIEYANDLAQPGDVVLLSPACASFDMFKNFEDRGQQFKKIVKEL